MSYLYLDVVNKDPEGRRKYTKAEWDLGYWLSAALVDKNICAEMKADINAWFEEIDKMDSDED